VEVEEGVYSTTRLKLIRAISKILETSVTLVGVAVD